MKGIILAGGLGTRLYPFTKIISKHLIPIYDKPMIYYPLATLMQAGIKEILIITTKRDLPCFKRLLGHGEKLGIEIIYAWQQAPRGLADAFIIAEEFIGHDRVTLILGDNIFAGEFQIENTMTKSGQAAIFGYPVEDARAYGVLEFDNNSQVVALEEKPLNPKSQYIIPGFYFYDSDVVEIAKSVKPSQRGELEITSINQEYLHQGRLSVHLLDHKVIWYDVGDFKSLALASKYIEEQKKNGCSIACIEEIAFRKGYIDQKKLINLTREYQATGYGEYLFSLLRK